MLKSSLCCYREKHYWRGSKWR